MGLPPNAPHRRFARAKANSFPRPLVILMWGLGNLRGDVTHDIAYQLGFVAIRGHGFAKEAIMKPLALILIMAAAPASGAGLEQDVHVTDKLVAAQVGDIIRNTCPSISARMFVVLGEMISLKNYAFDQGNSEAEIKAFLDSPSEKARIKALALDYLAKAGAVEGDANTYCTVGRAEIGADSMAGQLLRSSE
jgi:hypothetical protein